MSDTSEPEGNSSQTGISRRQILAGAGCAGLGFAAGWAIRAQPWRMLPPEMRPETAHAALQRLREGNQRFVNGKIRHVDENRTWRDALVADQHPFAVILGCSDSRVPIELVFDQGFGDVFVIRVAGNVISTDVVGSIAYSVAHLRTKLLVVMGHEGCGAVTAALQEQAGAPPEPESIEALLKMVGPSLRNLPAHLTGAARLSAAVEANVRWSMGQLTAIPSGRRIIESGQLSMVGAVYDLATGQVRFLENQ